MWAALLATAAVLACAAQAAEYAADYVIVGGGTAGCAIAARLCEGLPQAQVVLLERGIPRNETQELRVRALRLSGLSYFDPEVAERWQSEPNVGLGGKQVPVMMGNTLGGTSAINGAQFSRPEAKVPVSWGLRGLNSEARVEELYGKVYEQTMASPQPDDLIQTYIDEMLDASALAGSIRVDSWKGEGQDVVFKSSIAADVAGRRFDSAYAYLRPVMNGACSNNLKVIQGATVSKVLLEGSVATGVEYDVEGVTNTVHSSHEVILSAGAFASPKILMLSGIGPKSTLEQFGVPIVADLPVGEQAHSRGFVAHVFNYSGNAPPPDAPPEVLEDPDNIQAFLAGEGGVLGTSRGPMNGVLGPPIGAWRVYTLATFPTIPGPPNSGFYACVLNTDKRSRATVNLNGTDIKTPPAVDLNLLGHPDEVARMAACVPRLREESGNLTAFGFENITELAPGPFPLEEIARTQTDNAWHFVGSCGIGRVLDEDLKVIGFDNLRVVDASAIPDMTENSGPAASTYLLAEHTAAMIISDKVLGNDKESEDGIYGDESTEGYGT